MPDEIKLAHGGGGSLMNDLIRREILPLLGNDHLDALPDSARLDPPAGPLAFTTDSFVVDPLIFPGGDIGTLAVCGTVNDLAARGARPLALCLALIAEEGLPLTTLRTVMQSVGAAARQAHVQVVTGDTKVVPRGAAAGLFLTTAGIGLLPGRLDFTTDRIEPGDLLLINGPIAEHGIAVMSARPDAAFLTDIQSDAAPLADLVAAVIDRCGSAVKCMKDPTRGGLAASLNELALNVGFVLDEQALPIKASVRGACAILGLDPLTVANEGKMLFVVAPEAAPDALAALRDHPAGRDAAIIGHTDARAGLVRLRTTLGAERIVDLPYGEELPRIC